MIKLLMDVPGMLWHTWRYGRAERAELAQGRAAEAWLDLGKLAPDTPPSTGLLAEIKQLRLLVTGADHALRTLREEHTAELERCDRRWERLTRSAERWRKERDTVCAELADIRTMLAQVHDGAQYDDITTVQAVELLAQQRDRFFATLGRCHDRQVKAERELKQLRKGPAHERIGQTVTLRLENGRTVTGELVVAANRRVVRGWLVDVAGRALVGAPDGGGDHG